MSKFWFYKGKLVTLEASVPNSLTAVIVKVVADYTIEDPAKNTVKDSFYAIRSELQVVAADAFPLNTRIKTIHNGGLVGHVIGYDHELNRVVVVSDKVDKYRNDRTRYSYSIKELVEIPKPPKTFTFEKGKHYRINNQIMVQAVRQTDGLITLIDAKHRIRHTDLAPISEVTGLALNEGIETVMQVGK